MFFDDRLRGPQPMDSSATQDLVVESLTEELYNPAIPSEDYWKKFALPTPPYSPENYLSQASSKRNFAIPSRRNGLQVVPEPEDLSSDLPLVLSDAEMERLTCSTIDDEYIWPAGESDFDRVESQRFQGNRVVLSAACVSEPSAEMATDPIMLRDLPPFVAAVTNQDPALAQQQVDRWHFSGEYRTYFILTSKLLNCAVGVKVRLVIFFSFSVFHFPIINNKSMELLPSSTATFKT